MRKPAHEYTDDEIKKRIDFALRIIHDCGSIPAHLEEEYLELLAEQDKREKLIESMNNQDPNTRINGTSFKGVYFDEACWTDGNKG